MSDDNERTIKPEAGEPSAPTAGSADQKKPPFSEFVISAACAAAPIVLGILNLTAKHNDSDVDMWLKFAAGALLIAVGILQLMTSTWRLCMATIEMNRDNPPNDRTDGRSPVR